MMPTKPCACATLRGASRHLSRLYDAALAEHRLSINQYSILARLDRVAESGGDLGTLAEALVMDRSTLGHLLRPLQAHGWVENAPDAADRRRRMLRLTASGQAKLADTRPVIDRMQATFETALGASDASLLAGLLARVSEIERT